MSRPFFIASLAVIAAVGCGTCAKAEVALVRDGRPLGNIVLSAEASPSEKWAAEDLADHVKRMSGAELRIVTESDSAAEAVVILGDGPAARALGVTIDADLLGSDGYTIKTVGNRIVIVGGRRRGTMYGVYTLLESLGCRWWYPGEGGDPLVPEEVYTGSRSIKIPRWQGWARGAKKKLDQMLAAEHYYPKTAMPELLGIPGTHRA